MFQIIDAKSGGFAKTDGTEMPRDLDAMRMRRFHCGSELVGRNVHVRLE